MSSRVYRALTLSDRHGRDLTMLLQDLCQRPAGDLFEDQPEQHVIRVGIVEFRARIEKRFFAIVLKCNGRSVN